MIYDMKDEYNRALRIRRWMRFIAGVALLQAGVLAAVAIGALASATSGSAFPVIMALLILWGCWGFHYLSTRH